MDNSTIFLLAVVALLGLMFVFLFATSRRRDAGRALDASPSIEERAEAATARLPVPVGTASKSGRELERAVALERRGSPIAAPEAPPPPTPVPLDEEALGVTRRQVLNRGIVATFTLAISGFGAACVAMLWPSLSGGFGSKIRVGSFDEVMEEIADTGEPFYVGAGRTYINPYPPDAIDAARNVSAYAALVDGYAQGVVAIYQKCPHLGCRVPWCKTSQWFECPCHGSQYNRVGEKKGGPAPRGMDHFVATVENGVVVVDTGTVIPGPPIGVNTTGQESEGPHCIGAVSEH
ncbi:MAG: ubiquinol-cytochrome c reductase iron-sulfur subunit [Acidimicrobiales bacterium]